MIPAALRGLAALASTIARPGADGPASSVGRIRDLVYVNVTDDLLLVISADSNSGVGDKPNDTLRFSPEATGRSIAQVGLMEVIAVGARPLIIVDNLCVEMEPTGRRILAGIRGLVDELDDPVVITGSDETNMPSSQTGVGLTVIAAATPDDLRVGCSSAGDVVVAVGVPAGGPTHLYDEHAARGFASVQLLQAARATGLVHEVLPVGSHGIGFELAELAATSGLRAVPTTAPAVSLTSSGGASTCFLAAVDPADVEELRARLDHHVHLVGTLVDVDAQ